MANPKTPNRPRSREKNVRGSGKTAYKREKGEADNYAGPANDRIVDTYRYNKQLTGGKDKNAQYYQNGWAKIAVAPKAKKEAQTKRNASAKKK